MRKRKICPDCGKKIDYRANRCRSCATKSIWIKNRQVMYEASIKSLKIARIEAAKLPRTKNQMDNINKAWKKHKELHKKIPKRWISSWEDKFYNRITKFIKKDCIKRQFRLSGFRHPFDFAIPKLKILIEIDGKYFHCLPEHIARDKIINEYAQKVGWELFRYDDDKLKLLGVIK